MFPKWEMIQKQEIISKRKLMAKLSVGAISFPPLKFDLLKPSPEGLSIRVDAEVEARWEGVEQRFLLECRAGSTPRDVEEAAGRAKLAANQPGYLPLVLVPYLSENSLNRLEAMQVSGVDLNGNGWVCVPGKLLVRQSGAPNRFAVPASVANPYRGATSIVARTLLLYSEFPTAKDILVAARSRGATSLSLGTVSKALQALEDDLIVERSDRVVRLTDIEALLDQLVQNFREPRILKRLVGKLPLERIDALFIQRADKGFQLVPTGRWSSQAYGVGARLGPFSLYCSNVERLRNLAVEFVEDNYFPDVEFLETRDQTVYFDERNRNVNHFTWSSPVQAYLELMSGGEKRDREIAEQVRNIISPRPWP